MTAPHDDNPCPCPCGRNSCTGHLIDSSYLLASCPGAQPARRQPRIIVKEPYMRPGNTPVATRVPMVIFFAIGALGALVYLLVAKP